MSLDALILLIAGSWHILSELCARRVTSWSHAVLPYLGSDGELWWTSSCQSLNSWDGAAYAKEHEPLGYVQLYNCQCHLYFMSQDLLNTVSSSTQWCKITC